MRHTNTDTFCIELSFFSTGIFLLYHLTRIKGSINMNSGKFRVLCLFFSECTILAKLKRAILLNKCKSPQPDEYNPWAWPRFNHHPSLSVHLYHDTWTYICNTICVHVQIFFLLRMWLHIIQDFNNMFLISISLLFYVFFYLIMFFLSYACIFFLSL